MNNRKIVWGLFGLLCLLQLAVPLYMVWRWENILQTGVAYQWRTAPVDPYDALRGRYIDLRFKDTKGPVNGAKIEPGKTAYGLLGRDEQGFAYIVAVSSQKPVNGDYVEVRTSYMTGNLMNVTLPFKRFYMREDLAPLAEKAYQKNAGKDGKVTVRVKNGLAVIEQVYIGDQTIEDYLRAGN